MIHPSNTTLLTSAPIQEAYTVAIDVITRLRFNDLNHDTVLVSVNTRSNYLHLISNLEAWPGWKP